MRGGYLVVTIIFLVLSLYSWNKDNKKENAVQVSSAPAVTPAAASQTSSASVTPPAATKITTAAPSVDVISNQYDNIEQTLRIVSQRCQNTDVNNDRLYNCIDAAVLFYKYYPDKSKVSILLNRNPNTGMNHLFNAVLINGSWRAIEPQAYATGHSSYWMADVWGNKYSSSFNRDATQEYIRYVN